VRHEASLPEVTWFQTRLVEHGFALPVTGSLDPTTRQVLANFQMKYRPARYDGLPDAETAAILDVLTAPPGKLR
jgi:N-acetylmuramoyl-L-alanine amidase